MLNILWLLFLNMVLLLLRKRIHLINFIRIKRIFYQEALFLALVKMVVVTEITPQVRHAFEIPCSLTVKVASHDLEVMLFKAQQQKQLLQSPSNPNFRIRRFVRFVKTFQNWVQYRQAGKTSTKRVFFFKLKSRQNLD